MSRTRRRVIRAALLWTVLLVVVAVLVAVEAMSSLYAAHQACFFTAAVCPGGDDPAVVRLTFAFLGVPAIWLLGIVVGLVALALGRSRRRAG